MQELTESRDVPGNFWCNHDVWLSGLAGWSKASWDGLTGVSGIPATHKSLLREMEFTTSPMGTWLKSTNHIASSGLHLLLTQALDKSIRVQLNKLSAKFYPLFRVLSRHHSAIRDNRVTWLRARSAQTSGSALIRSQRGSLISHRSIPISDSSIWRDQGSYLSDNSVCLCSF